MVVCPALPRLGRALRQMTNDLIQQMVGHTTRLAQEAPARWHRREDRDLDTYVQLSRSVDRAAWAVNLLPRSWMLVGLAAGVALDERPGQHADRCADRPGRRAVRGCRASQTWSAVSRCWWRCWARGSRLRRSRRRLPARLGAQAPRRSQQKRWLDSPQHSRCWCCAISAFAISSRAAMPCASAA